MKQPEYDIHPDLAWIAKNLQEWHQDKSRLCVVDHTGGTVTPRFPMHCIPADRTLTYQQWRDARAVLKAKPLRSRKPKLSPAQLKHWDWRRACREINGHGKRRKNHEAQMAKEAMPA